MGGILIKNLVKNFKDFRSVNNISLEIKDGEFFVFLGPSGCGKTTLLRMIAGLEEVTSGNIYIGGKLVNNLMPKDRNIAMVFQNYGLYPHMNTKNNIAYPLKIRKIPKEQHEELILNAAKKVKIDNILNKKPSELSGGQRQRVALARAIVRKPNCFLMDEPLSNLDAKLRVSTRTEIKLLQKELKTTTIYVTHDQIEAMTMADKVAIMNAGEIAQVGTPKKIYNNPKNIFVAKFIGSPPMNIVEGKIINKKFIGGGIELKAPKHLKKGKVFLGFRAEDAKIETKKANLKTDIYNTELLGDCMICEIKINNETLSIKTDKNFNKKIGDKVNIKINEDICHFFNYETKERL